MESITRRITKLESQVQGEQVETFEQLMTEIHLMLEADRAGRAYTPRPLSAEVAKTLEAALKELRADPAFQHIFDDDAAA